VAESLRSGSLYHLASGDGSPDYIATWWRTEKRTSYKQKREKTGSQRDSDQSPAFYNNRPLKELTKVP
jgi:hypothetical protein